MCLKKQGYIRRIAYRNKPRCPHGSRALCVVRAQSADIAGHALLYIVHLGLETSRTQLRGIRLSETLVTSFEIVGERYIANQSLSNEGIQGQACLVGLFP